MIYIPVLKEIGSPPLLDWQQHPPAATVADHGILCTDEGR